MTISLILSVVITRITTIRSKERVHLKNNLYDQTSH